MKIGFKEVPDTVVSIIAQQSGSTFKAFQTKAGNALEMLEVGTKDAAAMFAEAQSANKMMTWFLRLGGWILLAIGFSMVFKPLSVIADVVPFIGNIGGAGTGIIAFLLSAILSLVVIAIAWLFYRPVLGITLLLLAVGVAVLLGIMIGKARKNA